MVAYVDLSVIPFRVCLCGIVAVVVMRNINGWSFGSPEFAIRIVF